MKFVFRADASLEMGTGHIMRCLTLADRLSTMGAYCEFICREHRGNLIEYVNSKGYITHILPIDGESDWNPAHSKWLGSTQELDSQRCIPILARMQPDWLVVDHYSLDASWENTISSIDTKLMVIDDLADRKHECNLLLDQTFGRTEDEYSPWISDNCKLLCGSKYALLRPEFSRLRIRSLKKRSGSKIKKILITLGGVDKDNKTTNVLNSLRECQLPDDCEIIIVLGVNAPWQDEVKKKAKYLPWKTKIHIGTKNMAQLMVDSDVAIAAAGSTSWELCCLGVPSILLCVAENQRTAIKALSAASAVLQVDFMGLEKINKNQLIDSINNFANRMEDLTISASAVTDGDGVDRVIKHLL